MIKKLLNARSPLWQLLIFGVFFYAAILITERETTGAEPRDVNQLLIFVATLALVALCTVYVVQILRYNRTHSNTPIRFLGLFPPELKEEDEGMRMFTARATRRVYIFHAIFLPILAIAYVYLLPPPVLVVAGLAFLVLGHFSIYLATIFPVLGEDEK